LGTNDVANSAADVSLYPNPANDRINVTTKLESLAKIVSYTVTEGTGRIVSHVVHNNVKEETFSIDTKSLVSGTYYLMILADGKNTVRKFVVTR
ncbi:MAG: T9SS type A sorting domain-containing protein, partial [Pedobacter sp.]